MPSGMYLKSEPYASAISSPKPGYELGAYSRRHGIDYTDRIGPVSLERLVGYADWYTSQLVPDVIDQTVNEITATGDGFKVGFAEAAPVTARKVVVATGVLPHTYIPPELSGLPDELVSHTAAHRSMDGFRGRRVTVIGAGQSALETAALLHEAGAETRLIVRAHSVVWLSPNPERIGPLFGRLRRPVNKLCEGWRCAFWNTPAAFRMLPLATRVTKARTVLGPAGAWWLKDRVDGVIEVLAGRRVRKAVTFGSRVRLTLNDEQSIDADHVICGTGFRVNLANLDFISEDLRSRVRALDRFPVLTRACESSVPGLYFTGALAAVSLGPSMRFLAGTHNVARPIARSVAGRKPNV